MLGLVLVRWLSLPEATRSSLIDLGCKAGGTVELSAEALRVAIERPHEAITPELVRAIAAALVRLRPTLPLRKRSMQTATSEAARRKRRSTKWCRARGLLEHGGARLRCAEFSEEIVAAFF